MLKSKKISKQLYMLYVQKSNDLKVIDKRVVSELDNYLKTVSTSIGVRQQSKLPRELALYLANCRASQKTLLCFLINNAELNNVI